MRILLTNVCAYQEIMPKRDKQASSGRPTRKLPKVGPKRRTNLTVDPDAARRGESFALRQGSSLSQLVTNLLHALPAADMPERTNAAAFAPIVQRLLGVARPPLAEGAPDHGAYREHLMDKYGTA